MSIFSPKAPCGPFAPNDCTGGTWQAVSFVRSNNLLRHQAPVLNSSGEVLLSMVAIGPIWGDLIPNHGGTKRVVGGIFIDVAYQFIVPGTPDIQELDRCRIAGKQLEVFAVNQFGSDHCEADLVAVAR